MTSLLIITTLIILLLAVLVITMLIIYQRRQVIYLEKLETLKHDYEKNLLQTQVEIQENTFDKISREIHDNICLTLTLAKLNLNTIDINEVSSVKEKTMLSLNQISKALTDLSDISKSMNSELISNQGLLKALEIELDKIKGMKLFHLKVDIEGDPIFLDSTKELVIFRIIQEAINNIIKHANATLVNVQLNFNGKEIGVTISDNGCGFSKKILEQDKDRFLKAGLNNIRKRAAIFNGSAVIESEEGRGTNIHVSIPY